MRLAAEVGARIERPEKLVAERDRVQGATAPTVLDVVTTPDAPFGQVQSPLAKDGPGGE